jgi:DNA recombination protein RmuC
MDTIIIFIVLLVVFGIGFYLIDKRLKSLVKPDDSQGLTMLNQNVQGVHLRMDDSTKQLNTRLDRAAEVIQQVSHELGKVQEIGRSMKELQDFMRSPKLRGNIGEQVMYDLLEQYFPKANFATQHAFRSGERVDAIVKTDKGIISIDAKFPLENFIKIQQADTEQAVAVATKDFIKDVKKHITDISKKYILPAEGTVDFAIMYVPSEAVYYEIIRQDEELNEFASVKKVLLVSPNSFYYFLKVLMIGLEGKKIEENAQKILEMMRAIQTDSEKFGESLRLMSGHMNNAKNTLDKVNNEYAKLSSRIDDVRLLK